MKQKILSLAARVVKSELISGSVYLFIGTMGSNIFAFLFNLYMARNLSLPHYAEVAALVSLITLASIPAQAFLPTIIQFSGRYLAKDQHDEAAVFYGKSTAQIGLFALGLALFLIIFSPLLGNFLHISNIFEIIIAGLVVATMYLSVTNGGFLQSLLRFQFLSFVTLLGGLLKLLLGVLFIFLGFGVFGVLFAYLIAFAIPLVLTFIPLRSFLQRKIKKTVTTHKSEIIAYGLPATVAVFSLSSFTSTDILLVKHFFPSSSAALYSGLSLVGRIIFYFSAPISTVMFPLVIKRFHKGGNLHNLLYLSFLLVLIPSLGLTAFYFLFPKYVIGIILGKKYFESAGVLGWFGVYLSVFSLLTVVVNFLLSIKKTSVSWFIAVGAILQAIGISLFHSSIGIVVGISLVLSLVLFVTLLLYYQSAYVNEKTT